jgi:outer membrane protein assembly factor BamB
VGDADADANDDGIADAPAGGPVVQWLYTINIDLTGAIQGFPMPAFSWNGTGTYSTYALMRDASGTADTIFVCDQNGDFTDGNTDAVTGYSFTLPGADIVGPLWWDTEGATHVVYFGTRDGRVYKLIDDTAAKQLKALPIGSPWTTGAGLPSPFVNAALTAVTSPLISDGTNLYFGGQGPAGFGVYKVVIATKDFAPFHGPISTAGVEVSTSPSWWDTLTGRFLYLASGSPNGRIYRINTGNWSIDALFPAASGCVALTNVIPAFPDLLYLYVGELNGRMHAVNAASTPADFLTQRPGFPFQDGSSAAIRGGAVVDFFTGRVFYGDASGNLYTVGATPPPFALGTGYFRLATGGGPIESMPLFSLGILYASNRSGKLYCIDVDNGAGGQTLLRTFSLGTLALGDVARDGWTTGLIFVGTAGGRMYAISPMVDPTLPQ